jgi:hypothetical protein
MVYVFIILYYYFSIYFLVTLGFELRASCLHHLSYASSIFCSGYFGDGFPRTIYLGWP